MKILCGWFLYFSTALVLQGGTVIIDDFSFPQISGWGPREVSSDSIFGGFRIIGATGFVSFVFVDGHFLPSGDTAGGASVSIEEGTLSISKTALTGSAYVNYGGRAFTDGDRIGDLNLNISGADGSVADPILLLGFSPESLGRTIFLHLVSDVDHGSTFDLYLPAGTSQLILDLRQTSPRGTGADGAADFGHIEEILLGYRNGNPAGAITFNKFAFVPEPTITVFLALVWGGWICAKTRNRVTHMKD